MQTDKSIKAKLLKYLFGLALMMLVFGATSITAYAYHCAGQVDCGCPFNCTGATCWYNSRSDSCKGHNFVDDSGYSQVLWSTDPCCCSAGSKKVRYYSPFHCTRCPISKNPYEDKSESNGDAQGHDVHGWERENDTYHVKKCYNSCHRSCCGSTVRESEEHNSDVGPYQNNDYQWHHNCSKCSQKHTYCGDNLVKVNTYGPNWSSGWVTCPTTIALPGLQYKASTHLYGFVNDASKSGTFTINQTTGAKAPIDFNAGAAQSGKAWCPSSIGQYKSERTLYGVWHWNYIVVNYFTSYGTGLTTPYKTLYVDASGQTLKAEDQISRTGYDIVSKGWFRIDPTLATNNKSNTKHTHKYAYKNPNECSDTAHIKFGETRNAYNWCKDVNGGTYADLDVTNNYQVTLNIAPHWRAHQLTIKYDENIKTGTSFPGTILGTQIMYYDDGYNYTTYYNPELYSLSALYPTRNGYTFMGWGVSRNWCTSRYASNSAVNESQGIKQAYDYTTASKDKRLAQEWATIGGKDLTAGDQTITLYAQWERIISYKFFYYKEGNTNNYDCNTSTVAFHNDDNEYLYMDIYMKRCCEAAFSVQKDADSGFFLCKKLSRPSHYRWTIF